MRIVFMGTPEFAVPSLEALLASPHQVVGVVTQPDRPKGRGQDVVDSPIKQICLREHIPFLQPTKMKDPAFLEALRAWQPDIITVTAFGRILPPAVLNLPPNGCVNVHGSLLPKYRGAGPVQWAIIRGEQETGITTMLMDEGMDTGAMLLQEKLEVLPDDTAGTLAPRLAALGGGLLIDTLARLKAGTLVPTKQDDRQATMAPLLKKEDGLIDWTLSAKALTNRVRGLSPWPGAYTFLGDERWNIWKAISQAGATTDAPGTIVAVNKQAISVTTGDGLLEIAEIQIANSKRMAVGQFLAGHRVTVGQQLGPPPHTVVN